MVCNHPNLLCLNLSPGSLRARASIRILAVPITLPSANVTFPTHKNHWKNLQLNTFKMPNCLSVRLHF